MLHYWKNFNNMQTITIIINELPYKNDKAWNALRLADELLNQDARVKIFLLEDGVDVGKENQDAKGKEYNLEELTKKLLEKNFSFVPCSTCLKVCGKSHKKLRQVEQAKKETFFASNFFV